MTDAAGPVPRIVVVGEALVDIVHRASGSIDETPGGSPANVALVLGRLGLGPTLVTRFADDDRGLRVRRWLEDSGVVVAVAAAPRTSTAVAHLDESGAATYEFDLDWDLDGVDGALVVSADLLHIGSIAAVLEPGASQVAALVRRAREHATVTYDPNIRPALVDDPAAVRARVAELVSLADIVKASDEDLRWLHPDRDLVEVAQEWRARGPALVVVTLGSEGAVAVTADSVIRIPAVRTTVVDTVGAGDTFMGTLIDGVLMHDGAGAALRAPGGGIRLEDLEELLRRSAYAAAITVSRPGADPPRRVELAARQH
ncbi:carbohydrate kinase family protein [Microbacterium allomyrinae]|uniref:Carbohydrate kinase n=1 Tax=Microbacterium allomyrinae TaxID=2830666 RepID=A0A9X1S314_9MICO|nr:carbohydrate kinase [Microbacterium allomyrinae]MCC2033281.1 carbohydrate kinase [Microbacterium allomyrinae]